MFKKVSLSIIASLVSLVMVVPAMAETKNRMQRKVRQVSGEILKLKQVEVRGAEVENIVALIKTTRNDRRLVVDLGPTSLMDQLKLSKGQKISVEGRLAKVRDRRFLVAHRIQVGDRTLNIDRGAQEMQFKNYRRQASLARQKSSAMASNEMTPQSQKGTRSTVIRFYDDSAVLTSDAKGQLRKLVEPESEGQKISSVTVAVFADREMPEQDEPTGQDIALANQRAESVENYLNSQLNMDKVQIVNMAYQRDDLVRWIQNEEAELESELGRQGERAMTKDEARTIREKGGASKVVILAHQESQRSPASQIKKGSSHNEKSK